MSDPAEACTRMGVFSGKERAQLASDPALRILDADRG